METTRRRDTKPELSLRRALHGRGLRYRVDERPLPATRARADIVFRAQRVAVFVNGCFWHGCPEHGTWPKHNGPWWRAKIEGNRARDARTDTLLRAEGWTVVRLWEHDALEDAVNAVVAALGDAGCRPRRVS